MSHLGGYIPGGDAATFYPDLWEWLVREQNVASVIDIGAGEGIAVDFFAGLGCTVVGVEGVPQESPLIVEHDYTLGPFVPDGRFDLAWCCEFVEHVEEAFLPNYLATFQAADLLLLTHAEPGQGGYHHVNCRTPDYWLGVLAGAGFQYDLALTSQARAYSRFNADPHNHFARSGIAFRRDGNPAVRS